MNEAGKGEFVSDVAVRDIHAAIGPVAELRDRYAAAGTEPLDPGAAQEIQTLAKNLGERGDSSVSPIAKRDLNHEATKLSVFLTRAGLMVGSDGLQFTAQ